MSTLSEEYITDILSKVAEKMKLTSWRYSIRKFENIGQNYFGIIIPVTLLGRSDDNYSGRDEIVLKLAPTDKRYRLSEAVTLMFNREVFVYSVLLKKYQEMDFLPPYIVPTLYFLRDEYCKEVIVMKNMVKDGYEPYTHESFLDLDHMTIALQTLARLHAMSFILKESDSKLYSEVKKVCVPLLENTNKRFMEVMIDRLLKALSKFEGTRYVPLLENLRQHCYLLYEKAVKLAKNTCICHGDIWKENILFKYESNNEVVSKPGVIEKRPVSACFIDYQTMRVSSPAFDVLYLIISSTDTHLRQENYNFLLHTYYESLKTGLERFQLDPEVIYSREALNHDLQLVAPACLITVNTALWLSNGLQVEGHVKSKKVWTTPEEKAIALDSYKSVIQGIVDDLNSYDYLSVDIMQLNGGTKDLSSDIIL